MSKTTSNVNFSTPEEATNFRVRSEEIRARNRENRIAKDRKKIQKILDKNLNILARKGLINIEFKLDDKYAYLAGKIFDADARTSGLKMIWNPKKNTMLIMFEE